MNSKCYRQKRPFAGRATLFKKFQHKRFPVNIVKSENSENY